MAQEATINVSIKMEDIDKVSRVVRAANAHVLRAKEKHGMETPADCYEPTMAELWESLIALKEFLGE